MRSKIDIPTVFAVRDTGENKKMIMKLPSREMVIEMNKEAFHFLEATRAVERYDASDDECLCRAPVDGLIHPGLASNAGIRSDREQATRGPAGAG